MQKPPASGRRLTAADSTAIEQADEREHAHRAATCNEASLFDEAVPRAEAADCNESAARAEPEQPRVESEIQAFVAAGAAVDSAFDPGADGGVAASVDPLRCRPFPSGGSVTLYMHPGRCLLGSMPVKRFAAQFVRCRSSEYRSIADAEIQEGDRTGLLAEIEPASGNGAGNGNGCAGGRRVMFVALQPARSAG